jgi:hypothetical protein
MLLNVEDDDEDNIDDDGEAAALDHVGVAVPAVERGQIKHERPRPSKYQIDIGDNKTMHIKTLLALLTSEYVTNKGITLSRDRVARIIQTARTSKSQNTDNGGTIARGVVEGNGTDKVVSGSWVAIAFEDEAKVGHFRTWVGMIQRIIERPKAKKASLWTNTLSLDDARIRDMWLNMAWLTPCDNAIPREALVYTWLPFCEAEEVCASYIISIPEVTWCPDTKTYILCAGDLRRLNEYLDTIAETIEPPIARATAGKKKSKRKNSAAVAEAFGITRVSIPGGEGKRSRIQKVY